MAAFQFRLATLLKLREEARDERRRQLAEGQMAADKLQERMDETHEELASLRTLYGNASKPGALVLDKLVDAQRYEAVVRSELHVLQDQSRLVAEEVERRRQALMEADREVRILEKLREKQQARHTAELAQQEIKEMDELAGRIRREQASS